MEKLVAHSWSWHSCNLGDIVEPPNKGDNRNNLSIKDTSKVPNVHDHFPMHSIPIQLKRGQPLQNGWSQCVLNLFGGSTV